MQCLFAYYFSAGHKLNLNITKAFCGEYIFAYRAYSFVAYLYFGTIGYGCRITGSAYAGYSDIKAGSHSQIVVISRNYCMIKFIGRSCSGNDHK